MSKTVQMLAPGDGTYRGSDGREYTAERFGQRATIHADDVAKMEEFGWQRADANKAMYPALEKAALGMAFSHASGGGNMPNIPARDDMRKRDFLSPAASAGYTTGTGHPVASNRRHELGEVEVEIDGGRHRVRVAHDRERGELHVHGATFDTTKIDRTLMRSFEATAAALNQMQGQAEDAPLREALGAILDRILRRRKFWADAVTRHLRHEHYSV